MKKILSSTQFAVAGYLLFSIGLFLYSFTQIDLSLVFSHNPFLHSIETAFQLIGYFNRPVSVELFLLIIIGLAIFYLLLLSRIRKKQFRAKNLWLLIFGVALLSVLAYNAFSYDIFNYIFDAKIVTFYHENPYLKKALDFPTDPMLSFMRWTHRVYPYGPIWLGVSVPVSYLGLQNFALTYFLFKLLMLGAYGGSVYFLYRILQRYKPEYALTGTAFFALNPLVLAESLVSAHNDIVMLFFALVAVYFLVQKRVILAFLFLILSIGIKFATIFLLPVFLYILFLQYQKKTIPWEKMFFGMFFLMAAAVIAVTLRTNFQPWYLLYILPFAAVLSYRWSVFFSVFLFSIVALLNYAPFLYVGNWDAPIPSILFWLNTASVIVSVVLGIFLFKREQTLKIKK